MANYSDNSSSSSTARNNDPNAIRQKALDLLNRMGGPEADDDESDWPQPIISPTRVSILNSYQQPQHNDSEATPLTTKERYQYQESDDGEEEDWGVMGLWVQCISEVCKKTPTFARSGYDAIAAVVADGIQEQRTKSSERHQPKGSFATVPLPNSYHQGGQLSGES
jgi:hypothetical protein